MLKTFFVLFIASSLVVCREKERFKCEDGKYSIVCCGYCLEMIRQVLGNGSTLFTCSDYPKAYFQSARTIMINSFDEVDDLGYMTLVVRTIEDQYPYDCEDGEMLVST